MLGWWLLGAALGAEVDPVVAATAILDAPSAERAVLIQEAIAAGGPLAVGLRAGHEHALEDLTPPLYRVRAWLQPGQLLVTSASVVAVNSGENPMSALVLRVVPNGERRRTDAVRLENVRVEGLDVTGWSLRGTVLEVPLPKPILPGDSVRLDLDAVTTLPRVVDLSPGEEPTPEDGATFGTRDGVDLLGYAIPQLTARVEGVWDRRPLPTMGEHSLFEPSVFVLTLDTPSSVEVAASGVEVAAQVRGARVCRTWVASGVREVAMVASAHLVPFEVDADGVAVRVWMRRDHPEAGAASRLAEAAAGALRTFDGWFGPWPYDELDVVVVPGTYTLGTEYPGLVTVVEGWRWDGETDPRLTIGHEVAHQWWYGEVGSDPQAHAWMDEALASWSSMAWWGSRLEPAEWDALHPHPWIPADRASWRYDLHDYAQVVYGRAPLFFAALADRFGEAWLRDALRVYAERFRHRQARPSDLLGVLGARAPVPGEVQRAWRIWILGETI